MTSVLGRLFGRSLRTQLIAWNVLALAVLLGVLGVVIRYTVRSFMMESVDRDLERQIEHGPGGLHGPRRPFGGPPSPPDDDRRSAGDRYALPPPDGAPPASFRPRIDGNTYHPRPFDRSGRSLAPNDTATTWDPNGLDTAFTTGRVYNTVTSDDVQLRVVSSPILDRGQVVAVDQAAYPLTDVDRAIADLDRALLTLIPIGLVFAGVGGSFLTDRVLRRVRFTTRAAERISAGDFSARLPVTGSDEFSELSGTFNDLLGRLESAYKNQIQLLDQQRRFTADASHELKTPLTIIKGTATMALSGRPVDSDAASSFREIDRAADSMSKLVQDLLLLARSDAGQLARNPIEMLVPEIIDRAVGGLSHDRRIEIDVPDQTLTLIGSEDELVRLIRNLVENAVQYTPPDARIVVAAKASGNTVVITVSDNGAGIAPEHLPRLGERFYRVESSRARTDGGAGLGLSICKSIVAAHNGTIRIASAPNLGTTAEITLPRTVAVA